MALRKSASSKRNCSAATLGFIFGSVLFQPAISFKASSVRSSPLEPGLATEFAIFFTKDLSSVLGVLVNQDLIELITCSCIAREIASLTFVVSLASSPASAFSSFRGAVGKEYSADRSL